MIRRITCIVPFIFMRPRNNWRNCINSPSRMTSMACWAKFLFNRISAWRNWSKSTPWKLHRTFGTIYHSASMYRRAPKKSQSILRCSCWPTSYAVDSELILWWWLFSEWSISCMNTWIMNVTRWVSCAHAIINEYYQRKSNELNKWLQRIAVEDTVSFIYGRNKNPCEESTNRGWFSFFLGKNNRAECRDYML